MKVYLDDEKTHVDPCPHKGHSVGWTVMTETIVVDYIKHVFRNSNVTSKMIWLHCGSVR